MESNRLFFYYTEWAVMRGICRNLSQDFEDSHHIFSLRGPIEFKPGYAFFTIEEEGKPIRVVFDEVLVYIQSFIREAIVKYDLDENKFMCLALVRVRYLHSL